MRVPRKEQTGVDPGILEDLERGAIPKGWAPADGILRFFGYNATNKCCRDWMLLGWPEVDGRPKMERDERMMSLNCPLCDSDLWFDIPNPDMVTHWDVRKQGKPQPPAIVGGRIRAGL